MVRLALLLVGAAFVGASSAASSSSHSSSKSSSKISPKVTTKASTTHTSTHTSTTSSCQPTSTYIADFENLSTQRPPPTNYASVNFNGFTVLSNASTYIHPHSGKQLALTSSTGASITQGNNANQNLLFGLKSFSFACVSNYPVQGNFPTPCSLKFVHTSATAVQQIQEFGPFEYAPNYTQQENYYFPMQNVTFDDAVGQGLVAFYLTSGTGFAQIVFDDVKILQLNNC